MGQGQRLSDNLACFKKNISSDTSLIYCNPLETNNVTSTVLNVCVGDRYYDAKSVPHDIDDNGITLKYGSFVVVDSLETIALPCNVFGVVTGKGKLIVDGIEISSGKIDPGFHDKLKIGVNNLSSRAVVIKRGEPISACYFIRMESTIDIDHYNIETSPRIRSLKEVHWKQFRDSLRNNIWTVFQVVLAFVAVILSLIAIIGK